MRPLDRVYAERPLPANKYYLNRIDLSRIDPRIAHCCLHVAELRMRRLLINDLEKIRGLLGLIVDGSILPSEGDVQLLTQEITILYVHLSFLALDSDPNVTAQFLENVYRAFRKLLSVEWDLEEPWRTED